MSALAVRSESGRQTTRVSPGALLSSAEASERIFGTPPPAGGVTLVSGRGSGQYDVRSTWAVAGGVRASRASARTQLPAPNRRGHPVIQTSRACGGGRLYSSVQSAANPYGGPLAPELRAPRDRRRRGRRVRAAARRRQARSRAVARRRPGGAGRRSAGLDAAAIGRVLARRRRRPCARALREVARRDG